MVSKRYLNNIKDCLAKIPQQLKKASPEINQAKHIYIYQLLMSQKIYATHNRLRYY